MADIHQWRRMVHPSRSHSQDLRAAQDQYTESGDVTGRSRSRRFSNENIEVPSVRLRPKSRLASYLGTHRSLSVPGKPDGAMFSASSANEKDDVYDPDPLQMSYTIQKRLLAFPAEGLPAQHNSLLMHLIEAFRDLTVDRLELLENLDKEKKSHEADRQRFQRNEILWLEEREIHRLKILNLESVLARPARNSPISGPATADSQAGPSAGSVDSLGATSEDTTAWAEETLENGWKVSCYQWPSSPSRRMARLSRRLLTLSNEKELTPISFSTSAGHAPSLGKHIGKDVADTSTAIEWAAPVPRRVSDSEQSSVEGDLLPDEEALIAAPTVQIVDTETGSAKRLIKCLADRVGSDPEQIYCKSVAMPKTLSKLGTENAEKPLPQLPGFNPPPTATDVSHSTVQRSASDEYLPPRWESGYHKTHRRGFSFLPGDDAKQPVISSPESSIGNMIFAPPLMEVLARDRPVNPCTHGLDPSLSCVGLTLSPQREASAGSAKTAIRRSISHSSSESIRTSCVTGPGQEGTGGPSKRPRKNSTAIAAARAASNSGSTSRWGQLTSNLAVHEYNQHSGEMLQLETNLHRQA